MKTNKLMSLAAVVGLIAVLAGCDYYSGPDPASISRTTSTTTSESSAINDKIKALEDQIAQQKTASAAQPDPTPAAQPPVAPVVPVQDPTPVPAQPAVAARKPIIVNRCGNGEMVAPEACDDGNNKSGDGCSLDCKIEPGWTCPTAGKPCTKDLAASAPAPVANKGLKEGCSKTSECKDGLYCSGGTCWAKGKLGETCIHDDNCESNNCVNAFCEAKGYVQSTGFTATNVYWDPTTRIGGTGGGEVIKFSCNDESHSGYALSQIKYEWYVAGADSYDRNTAIKCATFECLNVNPGHEMISSTRGCANLNGIPMKMYDATYATYTAPTDYYIVGLNQYLCLGGNGGILSTFYPNIAQMNSSTGAIGAGMPSLDGGLHGDVTDYDGCMPYVGGHDCQVGYVATGVLMKAGDAIDSIELQCGKMAKQ